jgi:hypothetical protein
MVSMNAGNDNNGNDDDNGRLNQLQRQLEQVTGRLAALEQAAARAPEHTPPAPGTAPAAGGGGGASTAPAAGGGGGASTAAAGGGAGAGPVTFRSQAAFPGAGFPGPAGFPDMTGDEAVFSYSGQGPFGPDGRVLATHKRARLSDVMNADADSVARVFTALGSPARITLLRALLNGPRSSQELRRELDDPSAGQLYHHLRELLAAGLVVQPARSVYAIPRGNQVDLCVQIAVAANLTSYSNRFPPPADDEADEDRPETAESQE